MNLLLIEVVRDADPRVELVQLAQVPRVNEFICNDESAWRVFQVFHYIDPQPGRPVARVRVES